MYSNKVVAAVKVNGQILRENGNTVALPFGSEYSVLVRNLNAVRIQFKLSLDGDDVTGGIWVVVKPNSAVEIERFIQDGDLTRGRRFKFIERTAAIEAHRGITADDGIVRVEWQVEHIRPVVEPIHYEVSPPFVPPPLYRPYRRPIAPIRAAAGGGRRRLTPARRSLGASASINEHGITVKGSQSHQQFHTAGWMETTGVTEVIVLNLRGKIGQKAVSQPITVDTKLACPTCGKQSKSSAEFCASCGTAIQA